MKVIALNSGGFDSVVMINDLLSYDYEVVSLFFNWGQPNYELEKLCAEKIGARCSEHIEVNINMPWVNTDMTNKMYIPMRNLVFSSYALSLAEQYNIKDIFMAIINNGHATPFFDCTKDFYNTLNDLVEGCDIQVHTPLIECSKYDLMVAIDKYNITKEDFFSCNTPINGEPCGICGDCEVLKDIFTPSIYDRTDFNTEDFRKAYFDTYVNEVRLLINNECQFTCKHCFYGCGEEKMPRFTIEEFKDVIDRCFNELKVNNIHFSGKEPMIDDTIFSLTKHIDENYPDKTYDIVTNGVTIPKFINELVECKNLRKIYLSVDTLNGDTALRNTNKHLINNINLLNGQKLPLLITLDVTKDNQVYLEETLSNLVALGVKDVYVRSIKANGDAKDLESSILNAQEYGDILDRIASINFPEDFYIKAHINKELVAESEDTKLDKYVKVANSYDNYCNDNFSIGIENYCYRYLDTVTITPDGYFLGCAMDVSVPHYDQLSGGNLHTDNIVDCLYKGRTEHLNKFICKSCKKGCTFTN